MREGRERDGGMRKGRESDAEDERREGTKR